MTLGEQTKNTTSAAAQPNLSWADLIRLMATGDESSLAEFYEQSNRLVFALVLRIVKERAVAEELLVDVYRHVWSQAKTYDAQRQRATDWIWNLTRQQAINRLRVILPTQEVQPLPVGTELLEADDLPQETFMFDEKRQRIRRALPQLNKTQRTMIECAFFEGLTQHEIATKFSVSPSVVQGHISSGMRKLHQLIYLAEKTLPKASERSSQ